MPFSYKVPHLVDTTMFWSTSIGGVRRFLEAKQRWFATQDDWRHTLALPITRPLRFPAATGHAAQRAVPVPSVALPFSGGYRLPLRRQACARVLVELQPDLIEADDPYRLAWAALDAARELRIPATAFCHSNLERMAALFAGRRLAGVAMRQARRYVRHLYSRFDLVFAPSEAMRLHLADCGVQGAVRQPLGVDTLAFHPGRRTGSLRRSLGVADGMRVVVYVGRFAPEKHLQVLADAVAASGPGTVLLAIGAGPVPPRGEQVIVQPFIRSAEQLAAAIADADALVHAGDQETFGLTVLEAMACGTPVIARAAEGLAELVDDSVGVPVHGTTSAAYAEAIDGFYARDREALSAAARARALHYDWSAVLPMLSSHYRRLLPNHPAEAAATPMALPA